MPWPASSSAPPERDWAAPRAIPTCPARAEAVSAREAICSGRGAEAGSVVPFPPRSRAFEKAGSAAEEDREAGEGGPAAASPGMTGAASGWPDPGGPATAGRRAGAMVPTVARAWRWRIMREWISSMALLAGGGRAW